MAVPKYKTSKARTRRRHTINMKLTAPTLIVCKGCGERILPHRICSKCGSYRGKQVIVPDSKA